jgi:hypothetical protein
MDLGIRYTLPLLAGEALRLLYSQLILARQIMHSAIRQGL